MSEHGWNDPPPLPYKTLQSSSAQKRSHLNKRPCYPADSVQVPAHHPTPLCPPPVVLSGLPPATGSIARNTKASDIASTGESTEAEVSGSTISCSQLMDSLERLIQDLVTSGAIERQIADEIRRRLGVFSAQWDGGSLSNPVQSEATLLIQALMEHNYAKAGSIQVSLMADHVSEVNQWLPGIKKLITVLQQKAH